MTDYAGFSSRYIGEYQTAIRLDVADASTVWSNSEINRAVERAVSDVDRHYPKEAVYEHKLDITITDEHWVAAAVGSWTTLAYKPIRFESELVRNTTNTTTYVRDTDYYMDYSNGKITIISTGDLVALTTYHISYEKSKIGVDISAIISNLLRINRIEYPVGLTPQSMAASFWVWNNFLYIGSTKVGSSQENMSDGKHIALYYEMPHTIPGSASAPTYPAFLDEVVCKGAIGYMYLTKADKYKQQAATDNAAALAILASGDFHTAIGAANAAAAAVAASITALDFTASLTAITDANTILDAIAGEEFSLASNGTTAIAAVAVPLINVRPLGDGPVARAAELIQARANVAATKVAVARGLLEDATQRINAQQVVAQNNSAIVGAGNVLAAKAEAYNTVLQSCVEEAKTYVQAAIQDANLAIRFYSEGQARLAEFETLLKEKAEYRKRLSTVMLTQPK